MNIFNTILLYFVILTYLICFTLTVYFIHDSLLPKPLALLFPSPNVQSSFLQFQGILVLGYTALQKITQDQIVSPDDSNVDYHYALPQMVTTTTDRKSTRLNTSH